MAVTRKRNGTSPQEVAADKEARQARVEERIREQEKRDLESVKSEQRVDRVMQGVVGASIGAFIATIPAVFFSPWGGGGFEGFSAMLVVGGAIAGGIWGSASR